MECGSSRQAAEGVGPPCLVFLRRCARAPVHGMWWLLQGRWTRSRRRIEQRSCSPGGGEPIGLLHRIGRVPGGLCPTLWHRLSGKVAVEVEESPATSRRVVDLGRARRRLDRQLHAAAGDSVHSAADAGMPPALAGAADVSERSARLTKQPGSVADFPMRTDTSVWHGSSDSLCFAHSRCEQGPP